MRVIRVDTADGKSGERGLANWATVADRRYGMSKPRQQPVTINQSLFAVRQSLVTNFGFAQQQSNPSFFAGETRHIAAKQT